ncbi:hypothetical protein [Arthrobacter sp. ERGS1:01]|uniref:hypothetical protein n=1 Tax=Arthrobacter sp. ERGS1:01 TaxID=1704044 RepID=UPI0012373F3B|nr:hypothetical protein [Arthrobacter sp. ERGS1:01]
MTVMEVLKPGPSRKNRPVAKINVERIGHVSANKKLLKYFGLPEVDFPTQQTTENVAILDDHLEALLESEWPEWVAACTALESESGVVLQKNQMGYRSATVRATGTPPMILLDAINRVLALAGKP